MDTALVIPDCHIPWMDEKAWDLMIEISQFQNDLLPLKQIVILGDFADCYAVSLHSKLPSHLQMTPRKFTDELAGVHYYLKQLRDTFPQAEIIYLEGNHEARLQKYIVTKCAEISGIIKTLPEILHLEEMKIKWVPYGRHQLFSVLNTSLYARHAPWDGGKHTARNSVDKGHISLLYGHTHRKQRATATTATYQEIECFSMGWLGDRNAEIFDYMDKDNWSQSFGFVFADEDRTFVDVVDIKKGIAQYHGQIYK